MTEPGERVRDLLRQAADRLPGGPVTVPRPDLFTGPATARRRRRLLPAAVFALVLLALAAPAIVLTSREPQPPSTPSETSAPPPISGPPAVDCGTFELGRSENLPDHAIRCFARALTDGRPARLKVTLLTVEGDPIVHRYRSEPDGRVEVIIDTTRDNFGDQEITRQVCFGPTPGTVFTFSECSQPMTTTPIAD